MNLRHSVYILTNKKRGVLYIGVSNNITERVWQHKNRQIDGFSKKYNLTKVVHVEFFNTHIEAISREKQLKTWRREWKIALIETNNPEWSDLFQDIETLDPESSSR